MGVLNQATRRRSGLFLNIGDLGAQVDADNLESQAVGSDSERPWVPRGGIARVPAKQPPSQTAELIVRSHLLHPTRPEPG